MKNRGLRITENHNELRGGVSAGGGPPKGRARVDVDEAGHGVHVAQRRRGEAEDGALRAPAAAEPGPPPGSFRIRGERSGGKAAWKGVWRRGG